MAEIIASDLLHDAGQKLHPAIPAGPQPEPRLRSPSTFPPCSPQELDSVILLGPLQLRILDESMATCNEFRTLKTEGKKPKPR